jgi:hypothetical protein
MFACAGRAAVSLIANLVLQISFTAQKESV